MQREDGPTAADIAAATSRVRCRRGGVSAADWRSDSSVADARVTLGAVASHPVEATEAAAQLIGQRLTPELIDAVAIAAAKRAKPLDNADLTINYRKQVTPIFIRRALSSLVDGL